jgi:hypothetical protein
VFGLIAAFTLLKIAATAYVGGSADVGNQRSQAVAFLSRLDVSDPANTGSNPSFFPAGHYGLCATSLLASRWLGLPFERTVKWPAILADAGLAAFLLSRAGATTALLYLFNPLSTVLSVYHGQMHTVAVFLACLALGLAEAGRPAAGGAILAAAASVRQHLALLMMPLLRGADSRKLLLAAFAAPLVAFNLPLFVDAERLWARAAAPAVNYGAWGWSMLLLQGPRLLQLAGVPDVAAALAGLNDLAHAHADKWGLVWGASFAVLALRRTDLSAWRAAFVYLLGIYVLNPGVAVQWLIYGLPFFLLLERRCLALVYTALASAFVLGSYWQWTLNRKYRLASLTANLDRILPAELMGVVAVGALGLLTWLLCGVTLARQLRPGTGARG